MIFLSLSRQILGHPSHLFKYSEHVHAATSFYAKQPL
jgi:hypothetical protein